MSRLTPTDLDDMRDDAAAVDAIYVSGGPVDHDTRVLAGHTLELLDEVAALRAALDAIAEHLRPALEAEAGATAGPWREVGLKSGWYIRSDAPEFDPEGGFVCESGPDTWDDHDDVRLVLALRNALPAVRATLKGVGK